MTDKVQKIKEWISKEQNGLMDAQGNFEYPEHEGAYHILCNLDAYIDSLQEEPIEYNPFDDFRHTDSEEPISEPQVKESAKVQHKAETCKESGNSLTQESVSEDLRDAARKYFKSLKDYCFISSDIMLAFKAGAKWQKKHG
jgi:hypothetical protein